MKNPETEALLVEALAHSGRLLDRIAQLEMALAAWEPVVRAAVAWRRCDEHPDVAGCLHYDDLADAVDALTPEHRPVPRSGEKP